MEKNISKKSEIDVLVVGAGPTGLTMACELLRHGVSCRVIDKAATPASTSRALGIQARTLETFAGMGIIDKILARGLKATGVIVYDRDKELLHISLGHLGDIASTRHMGNIPYPYLIVLPQADTEAILIEHLHELGGEVERSQALEDIRQENDYVLVSIASTDNNTTMSEEIRAKWVIGCDGAHSVVRKMLAIPFEGAAYADEFLLADVEMDWNKSRENTHGWLHHDGLFAVFPLPHSHQWRIFADVAPQNGQEIPQASLELFQQLLVARTGDTQTTISNPTWMSNFKINRRMVKAYRQGHVFLAGDAAHIHSPFGGQGMNTGIQDAYNLAWKLALVHQGKAPATLLDTYEEERLPVARHVLQGTHAGTSLLVNKNPALRLVRDQVVGRLLSLDIVQQKLAQEASELDIHYHTSSLSQSYGEKVMEKPVRLHRQSEKPSTSDWLHFRNAPHAGDRAPDGSCLLYPSSSATTLFEQFQGTTSTLLLFAGLAPTTESYAHLTSIAQKVEAALSNEIKVCLIVHGNEKPEHLNWDGSILLDTDGYLHTLYGAGVESLYFIRPDGYIGLRGQPAREEPLFDYLGKLFLLQ